VRPAGQLVGVGIAVVVLQEGGVGRGGGELLVAGELVDHLLVVSLRVSIGGVFGSGGISAESPTSHLIAIFITSNQPLDKIPSWQPYRTPHTLPSPYSFHLLFYFVPASIFYLLRDICVAVDSRKMKPINCFHILVMHII
jgi:hypothetical protein